jgi:hypothetical protein
VFREAGTQVSPVTMSRPSPRLYPVCGYKRPLKEEGGLLLSAFGFGGFTLGFLVWEAFGREKNY